MPPKLPHPVAFAETIWKTISYLHRIHSNDWRDRLEPEAKRIAERVRSADRILLLGVVAAMPSVFHVDIYRRVLQRGIETKLKPEERAWLDENANRIVGWHVIDSEEVAEFVAWRDGEGLLEAVGEYINLPDFGRLLARNTEMLLPFHEYFAARGRQLGRYPKLPPVDAAVQRFGLWATKYLLPNFKPPSDFGLPRRLTSRE